jgi:hypothetical protein
VNAHDRSADSSVAHTSRDHEPPQHCEITVQGHLAPRWSAWFDGLDLVRTDRGTTVISGPVVDQSALHGLLQKLRDLGIPLISLTTTASSDDTDNPERP